MRADSVSTIQHTPYRVQESDGRYWYTARPLDRDVRARLEDSAHVGRSGPQSAAGPWVKCECQGRLLRASIYMRSHPTPNERAPRGKIVSFTRRARARLISMFQRLDPRAPGRWTMITLTYGRDFPTPRQSKRHLRAFLERLRRRYPDMAAVWRLEMQKRGAPHYHLMCYAAPFIAKEWVQGAWGEIIGFERPFTRIEAVRSANGVMSYCAKYLAKVDSADSGAGLDCMSYLHVDGEGPGRFWGIFNRENLPWGVRDWFTFRGGTLDGFYRLRRTARRAWSRVSGRRFAGFSLFTDGLEQWWQYARYEVLGGREWDSLMMSC